MATMKEIRKHFISEIVSLLDILDPSGDSGKYYTEFFTGMDDAKLKAYLDWWFEDERNDRLKISVLEFEKNITQDAIVEASEFINVPLYEYVALPDLNGSATDAVVCTPTRVPVGYVQPKRMPQTVFKKSAGSISTAKRNAKTGQVTGDDKNARTSDAETYSMLSIGAEAGLREFLGPRADDAVAEGQMNQQIAANGYVRMEDIETDRRNKTAVNTMDEYFKMQGFMTNIIYPPDHIPSSEDPR